MSEAVELPGGFGCHVANIGVKDETDDFVVVVAEVALVWKSKKTVPVVGVRVDPVLGAVGWGEQAPKQEPVDRSPGLDAGRHAAVDPPPDQLAAGKRSGAVEKGQNRPLGKRDAGLVGQPL